MRNTGLQDAMIAMRREGKTLAEIAAVSKFSIATVWRRTKGMPRAPLPHPLRATIYKLRQEGLSLRAIGARVELSYERVRQIINSETGAPR